MIRNKLLGFVISILLGLLLLIAGIVQAVTDTRVDIKRSNVALGKVVSKDIVFTKGKNSKRLFQFNLDNSDQDFTIYRSYEGYTDLQYNINIGDTLNVFYKPVSSGLNRTVYQVEKDGTILENYESYDKQSSTQAVILIFAGLFVLLVAVFRHIKLSASALLMKLVDPEDKKNSS